jgi:hypothetical protein
MYSDNLETTGITNSENFLKPDALGDKTRNRVKPSTQLKSPGGEGGGLKKGEQRGRSTMDYEHIGTEKAAKFYKSLKYR